MGGRGMYEVLDMRVKGLVLMGEVNNETFQM